MSTAASSTAAPNAAHGLVMCAVDCDATAWLQLAQTLVWVRHVLPAHVPVTLFTDESANVPASVHCCVHTVVPLDVSLRPFYQRCDHPQYYAHMMRFTALLESPYTYTLYVDADVPRTVPLLRMWQALVADQYDVLVPAATAAAAGAPRDVMATHALAYRRPAAETLLRQWRVEYAALRLKDAAALHYSIAHCAAPTRSALVDTNGVFEVLQGIAHHAATPADHLRTDHRHAETDGAELQQHKGNPQPAGRLQPT